MGWIIAVVSAIVLARIGYEHSAAVRQQQRERLDMLEGLNDHATAKQQGGHDMDGDGD